MGKKPVSREKPKELGAGILTAPFTVLYKFCQSVVMNSARSVQGSRTHNLENCAGLYGKDREFFCLFEKTGQNFKVSPEKAGKREQKRAHFSSFFAS